MKISEKKALEAYPICNCYNEQCMMQEDVNLEYRIGYEEGYDQAMQDFLEYLEHCSTFTDMNGNTRIDKDLYNTLIEQFKNYMEEEL